MLLYTLFFFIAMGSKLLLALLMIYLLLPSDRQCNLCDEETLLLQLSGANGWFARLCMGTLQRRWCPACGWEGYARSPGRKRLASPARSSSRAHRTDDAREFLN
jgi:hypothetical protein